MAAHSEIERYLSNARKSYNSATAGITSLSGAGSNFSHQELKELLRVVEVSGHEVVITAGAVKIRPKDSTL